VSKTLREEEYFYLRNGSSLKSIEELYDKLEDMLDEDFFFHVNEEKNDFANWIKGVFGEKELSDNLSTVKTKKEVKKILDKFLKPKETHSNKVASAPKDKLLSEKEKVRKVKKPEPVKEAPKIKIPEEDFEEEKKKEQKEPELDDFLENVRSDYKIKKKEKKKQVEENEEEKPNFFSRLWIKLKASKLLGKTIFRKSYVDNQVKELDEEIDEFGEDIDKKLGDNSREEK